MGDVVNVCDYITNFPLATCPINDCDNQSNGLIVSGQYYDLYTIIKETDCAAVGIILTSTLSIGTLNCVAGDVTAPISITFNDITSFANGTEIVLNMTNTVAPLSVSSVVAPLSGFTYNSTTNTITITDDSLITNTFAFDLVLEYPDCSAGFTLTGVVGSYTNLVGAPTIGTQTGDTEIVAPIIGFSVPTTNSLNILTGFANETVSNTAQYLSTTFPITTDECARIEFWNVATNTMLAEINGTTLTPLATWTDVLGNASTYMQAGDLMANFDWNKRDFARDNNIYGNNATAIEIRTFVGNTSCGSGGVIIAESVNIDNISDIKEIEGWAADNQGLQVLTGNPAGTTGAMVTFAPYDQPRFNGLLPNPSADILGSILTASDLAVSQSPAGTGFAQSIFNHYAHGIRIYLTQITMSDGSVITPASPLLMGDSGGVTSIPQINNVINVALAGMGFVSQVHGTGSENVLDSAQGGIGAGGQVGGFSSFSRTSIGAVTPMPEYINFLFTADIALATPAYITSLGGNPYPYPPANNTLIQMKYNKQNYLTW